MTKTVLLALAAYFTGLAAVLILAPQWFYDTVPGVSESGPFNSHFTRDVGFAFLVSALALALGTLRSDRMLALIGAGFPVLHGLFHIVGIGHHSFDSQLTAIGDLIGTAGIAALALILAARVKGGAA